MNGHRDATPGAFVSRFGLFRGETRRAAAEVSRRAWQRRSGRRKARWFSSRRIADGNGGPTRALWMTVDGSTGGGEPYAGPHACMRWADTGVAASAGARGVCVIEACERALAQVANWLPFCKTAGPKRIVRSPERLASRAAMYYGYFPPTSARTRFRPVPSARTRSVANGLVTRAECARERGTPVRRYSRGAYTAVEPACGGGTACRTHGACPGGPGPRSGHTCFFDI